MSLLDTAGWIGVYGASALAPSGGGAAYIRSLQRVMLTVRSACVASGSGINAQVILTRPVYADFTAIEQETDHSRENGVASYKAFPNGRGY